MVSCPLHRILIENQVVEANANRQAASAATTNVEQALTQQVTNAYLDTLTLRATDRARRRTGQDRTGGVAALEAAIQARLGDGGGSHSIRGSTHGAQTRLAETQYDYKIAEVTLAYTSQETIPVEFS